MKLPPYFTTKVEPRKSWMYGRASSSTLGLGDDLLDVHRRRAPGQRGLPVHVHDLGRREAVEVGRRGVAVGADVVAVDQVAALERRAGSPAMETTSSASQVGPNTEQICVGPFLNAFTGYLQWSKMMPE